MRRDQRFSFTRYRRWHHDHGRVLSLDQVFKFSRSTASTWHHPVLTSIDVFSSGNCVPHGRSPLSQPHQHFTLYPAYPPRTWFPREAPIYEHSEQQYKHFSREPLDVPRISDSLWSWPSVHTLTYDLRLLRVFALRTKTSSPSTHPRFRAIERYCFSCVGTEVNLSSTCWLSCPNLIFIQSILHVVIADRFSFKSRNWASKPNTSSYFSRADCNNFLSTKNHLRYTYWYHY